MDITSQMVRELREMTGAGMMDCKKALDATGGDVQAAIDYLRKKGMKSADKKVGRETAEGRVFAAVTADARRGHLVGLACETDFLAKGDNFIAFVEEVRKHVMSQDPATVESLVEQGWQGGTTKVGDTLKEAVGQFGENIRVTDLARLENGAGLVGTYVHHDNKKGAIVSVTSEAKSGGAGEVLNSLCQHILVYDPAFATREDVPSDVVERERAVIGESDELKKKPEAMREKIIDGKMGKFYQGCVLEEQPWIHDDKTTVAKAIEKALGAGSRVQSFRRVVLGG